MVKSIYAESNSSAGARTIAGIATTRGLPLSRYVATRLMKEQGLGVMCMDSDIPPGAELRVHNSKQHELRNC